MTAYSAEIHVIGGVDTHKDLYVAAVVDHRDRVLGTESFPTTRHGYRLMLAWMRSFGDLRRVGVECSGSYGAGLLRYLQAARVEVLEVTALDKHDRRRRGKNDDSRRVRPLVSASRTASRRNSGVGLFPFPIEHLLVPQLVLSAFSVQVQSF